MSVVNRERRKNAGKRMAILGAKMAEEDDAFWSHETWADDNSGNESFHESDEDSALQKDVFDSDFNDSESDNEDDEVAAGEAEERELRKNERASKSNSYKQPGTKFGGHKRRRGFPGGVKRTMGEGFNAGIVLNLPPESYDSLLYSASIEASRNALIPLAQTQQSISLRSTAAVAVASAADTKTTSTDNNFLAQLTIAPPPIATLPSTGALIIKAKAKTKPVPVRKQTRSSKASLRERRSTHGVRKLRGRRDSMSTATTTTQKVSARSKASNGNASDSTRAAKRKKYAQEELLLEAVHETEPGNQRWLHSRKRVQDQHNRDMDSNANGLRDRHRGKKIIQKFHSRRGCLITLTFPEMDAVPEILTRRHKSTKQVPQQHNPPRLGEKLETSQPSPLTISPILQQQQQQQFSRCVITGKIGKYKDPLTKHPYHDLKAFRELRRRHKEGIALIKSEGAKEGSDPKMVPDKSSRNNPANRKRTMKAKNNKRAASTVRSSDNTKKPVIVTKEEVKKSSSATINVHQKLPFQSPKPPPNPSINGSRSAPHPSNPNATANKQQHPSSTVDKLAFSWGPKPAATTGANAASAKDTNSPASPRRLSPRKWKPSEKILETISMLPGKNDGSIPRGLGIQPGLPTAPSLNSKSKTTTVNAPLTSTSLAPKPLPPESSVPSNVQASLQKTQTEKLAANGGPCVQASTVETPNITGSSAAVASSGHSKEKADIDNGRGDTIIETKVEKITPNGSAISEAGGDKTENTDMTGKAGGIEEKAKPI